MILNKDPDMISSFLDFLFKMLGKFKGKEDNKDDYYEYLKEVLGIEMIRREQKVMFYNIKCKVLEDKSLLEFIDSQNVRLSRQREELIDLSVKIANLNNRDETEEAMDEVIKHYKSGLPSGVGLRDMLTQIKERYPWSSAKKKIMIFVSLVTCLLAIGLFIFDVTTDIQFSLNMFNEKKAFNGNEDFDDFLSKNNFIFLKSVKAECYAEMNSAFKENYSRNSTILDDRDYKVTAWIALYHCVQPFIITLVVFLSMKCCKRGKCSSPEKAGKSENKKWWWCINSLLCCIPNLTYIGSLVPLPGLTNLYRLYLDVRSHIKRSKPDFRTRIVKIEKEIREHEALGEL